METYDEILAAAKSLPMAERAQLLDALWESIDADDSCPLSEAWIAELNRRCDAIDAGEMSVESWDVVRRRAWKFE